MDADFVVWLIFIVVWLITSAWQAVKKMAANRPGQTPPSQQPPTAVPLDRGAEEGAEAVRELMRQMGFEVEEPERPVASEHRPTASEHRPTAAEQSVTPSEHRPTASEHRATASEALATASEQRRTASEHRRTRSEHRRGDAILPPIPRSAPAAVRRPRATLARAVHRDLTRGRRTLAEILALREVIGPPVGLRPYDADGL